jgi:hypothetical protein
MGLVSSSVADPGCFHPSRISDPKTATKERGEKNLMSYLEKIWANFQRIIELFTQRIVTKLSKVWVWDPGSGKNLFRIPDPGVKKAPDPGSGTLGSRGQKGTGFPNNYNYANPDKKPRNNCDTKRH